MKNIIGLLVIGFLKSFVYASDNFFTSRSGGVDERIIGGENTDIKEIPSYVQIILEGKFICGGNILSEKHVLTAAHCMQFEGKYGIIFGATFLNDTRNKRRVEHFKCHPGYDLLQPGCDVALLKLATSLTFCNTVKAVAIAPTAPKAGETIRVYGLGVTSTGGKLADQLQKVEVTVLSFLSCFLAYAPLPLITQNMLCAAADGKDSCQGDSGGAAHNLKGELCAIVSFGRDCADPKYPGVYANLEYFQEWIKETQNSNEFQ